MHILLIHQAFATLDEAGGTRHYEMARLLVKRGHRVTVITSPISYLSGKANQLKTDGIQEEHPEGGIHIIRVYAYPEFHKSFFHRVLNFLSFMISSFFTGLRVKNVDLVWGTSPPIFQGWTAWLIARLKKAPFLFEVRDLWPDFAIAAGVLKNPLLIRSSYWLEKFLYLHADRVIVNSPGFIEHITRKGAQEPICIPNGVDASMFFPESHGEVFRKLHELEGLFVVLYAGAHGLSNDLGVVLEAACQLKTYPKIKLVLIGDGKEKSALRADAEKWDLWNLEFLPSVPKNEMADALAGADVCLAILKPLDWYQTTYPNKVFDYMAAGRPVLLVIDGVIRKVVEEGKAGIFVPPGNAKTLADGILEFYNHPDLCRKMGKNGLNLVLRQFQREQITVLFADLVEKMEIENGRAHSHS